jgi:ubiquinol-cytochrome c reductase iron-sulfur subunit
MAGKTRRDFILLASSAMAVAGMGFALWPFISSMNPSADVISKRLLYVNITGIRQGESKKVIWETTPVYIRHLTTDELKAVQDVAIRDLLIPQSVADRTKPGRESWVVLIGQCTHEGCIVQPGGYSGGWLCHCCGSSYDILGRATIGPIIKNLFIPPYRFDSDGEIVIGTS